MVRIRRMLPVLLIAVAATLPASRAAEPDVQVERGARLYRAYCSNCHGGAAKGDGPTAKHLKVRPPDLTRIAVRSGGEFPAARVHAQIDGRDDLAGHGNRQMPIWGLSFQDPGFDGDQQEAVRERIGNLVAFLESIQIERP